MVSDSQRFKGSVPVLSLVLSCRTFLWLTDLPCFLAHDRMKASSFLVRTCKTAGFGMLIFGSVTALVDGSLWRVWRVRSVSKLRLLHSL